MGCTLAYSCFAHRRAFVLELSCSHELNKINIFPRLWVACILSDKVSRSSERKLIGKLVVRVQRNTELVVLARISPPGTKFGIRSQTHGVER